LWLPPYIETSPPLSNKPLLGLMSTMPPVIQAIFRRQRAGDEFDRRGEPRIERLAEHADAFGKRDAVEPVLQRVVLAADMELPVGILRHAGHLQDDLIEQVLSPPGVSWMSWAVMA
jgi:hypothetical protein